MGNVLKSVPLMLPSTRIHIYTYDINLAVAKYYERARNQMKYIRMHTNMYKHICVHTYIHIHTHGV